MKLLSVLLINLALVGLQGPPHPDSVRTVGTVQYSGPHTWAGVIEVARDNITYQDGTLKANVTGVPQGVTFVGDRKNITLRNLTFNGVGDGISINNNQRVDDFTIDQCKFIDTRSPDATSSDVLLGQRGLGIYGHAGRNWTIRQSVFRTKPKVSEQNDRSAQYACRLGNIMGLNVSETRFENWAGKACVWLMFVRAASFNDCHFEGGAVRIGVRPNDMPGVDTGDCKNIVFRKCTFKFGVFDHWPAAVTIFPGAQSITFEDCRFETDPESTWWIEIDSRETTNIHWKNCTWNGSPIGGYKGVRSSMSFDQMRAQHIGPAE